MEEIICFIPRFLGQIVLIRFIPPEVGGGGELYWNQVVHLSVGHTFVWKISSEPLNCMQLNFCVIVHHHDLECHAKDWVPIFKVTVQAQILKKITLFHIWTIEPFASTLVVHHHKPEFCVTILDCCPQGHGKRGGDKLSGNICPNDIF